MGQRMGVVQPCLGHKHFSMGLCRYRPEVAAQVKGFSTITPDGLVIDIAVNVDPSTKV